ncbi:MAG: hypothetical protein AUG51_20550 [Acidobacteria bacterium 13_1_20CM_3_53_8]|nr:MAG: hypothetical protein AUG51_20550 [Acidobacteria bacterium 13_1_20CM_3_53_8]
MQYSEFEQTMAIISDSITLVLPAIGQQPLRFLRLPLTDVVVSQSGDGSDNKVIIRYLGTTGYKISQGVKRDAEDIHLILGDPAQKTTFAKSLQSRAAKRLADTRPVVRAKATSQRTSYVSVDLSQSRETSVESDEEATNFVHITEAGVSINLPSRSEAPDAAESQNRQEGLINGLGNLIDAQITNHVPIPAMEAITTKPSDLQPTRRNEASKRSTEQEYTMSSIRADGFGSNTMKDSRRQLRRPHTKGARNAIGNDVDWDEGLRDNGVELKATVAKKGKTTSKKAKKPNNATTSKILQSRSEPPSKQKKTKESRAMLLGKPTTTTRTSRKAVPKSAKCVEESEASLDIVEGRQGNSEERDSDPLLAKNALSEKDDICIDNGHARGNVKGRKISELGSNNNLIAEGSSAALPPTVQERKRVVQNEAANESHAMDTAAKKQAPAQNGTSFGTKLAQALTAKAHLPVTAIPRPSGKAFGDVRNFVRSVNATKSSTQKSPARKLQALQPESRHATNNERRRGSRRITNSTAQNSLAQSENAELFNHMSETCIANKVPEYGDLQSRNVPVAYEEAAPTSILSEDLEETSTAGLQRDDMVEAVPGAISLADRDLAVVALKQAAFQKATVTRVKTLEDVAAENLAKGSNVRGESPETQLSKSANTAPKLSSSKRLAAKVLQAIPNGEGTDMRIKTAPLLRRSERRSVHNPVNRATVENNSSIPMTDERIQRKTPIITFSARDPCNQGVVSPNKQPRVGNASVLVPSETGKHLAAERQKKVLVPTVLPALADERSSISGRSSELVEDGGILVQERAALASIAFGISSDVNKEDHSALPQEGSRIKLPSGADVSARRKVSQSSRVDENGSPRLSQSQPQKSLTSASNSQDTSTAPMHIASSAFTSKELQNPVYAENGSSSAASFRREQDPNRVVQPLKAKVIHARHSIGLQDTVSKTSAPASKSMNTAALKEQVQSKLCESPVVVQKTGTVVEEDSNILYPKTSVQAQAIEGEIDRTPPPPFPRRLFYDPSTRVSGLRPETSAELAKLVEASLTPTSFKTKFTNMLMPPPPLPLLRQEQPNLIAALARQGMRKRSPTAEDADVTLVNNEDSVEQGRRQPQQSPDSSTNPESSTTPESARPDNDLRRKNGEASSQEIRITQQRVLNILNRATSVSASYLL